MPLKDFEFRLCDHSDRNVKSIFQNEEKRRVSLRFDAFLPSAMFSHSSSSSSSSSTSTTAQAIQNLLFNAFSNTNDMQRLYGVFIAHCERKIKHNLIVHLGI